MSDDSTIPGGPRDAPFQFRLKEAAVWMLVLSVLFALIFQWGFWGIVAFLALVAIGVLCYGTYWGEWKLASIAAGILLFSACAGTLDFTSAQREADPPPRSQHKLKQIGLALHNYHDTYGCFPPPYIADASGKPMHSWRVLILPYMDEVKLSEQYDFNEPWNGPSNRTLAAEIPDTYRCSDKPRGSTTDTASLALVGPESLWRRGATVTLADVIDPAAGTLAVVEVEDSGVNWMTPLDMDVSEMPLQVNPPKRQGVSSSHLGGAGAWALFVDGSVRFLPNDLPSEQLRASLTIAGNEADVATID
jgi:hypothetical protein